MVTPPVPSGYLLTYEDWMLLPHDDRRCELIDGELFVSTTPAIIHQRVSRDLAFLLVNHLRHSGAGELLFAPTGVKLDERSVLEPDILVVLREHADRVGERVIDGAPDLVIEILSPGTARRDLGIKSEKYATRGIPEYWIVDPIHRTIEVLVLEAKHYVRLGLFEHADTLRSRVLANLALSLGDVFTSRDGD